MFNIRINVTPDADTKATLVRIADALERMEFWQRPRLSPGQVVIASKEQITVTQFGYKFALPLPENPADVAKRSLVVTVNGDTATEYELSDPGNHVSGELIFDVDSSVSVVVKDYDAAGNSALGAELLFIVNDDVPPSIPGAVAVMEKRQLPPS